MARPRRHAACRPLATRIDASSRLGSASTKRTRHMKDPRSSSGNWNIVEGKWTQLKGKLREKWGKLTDDDLDVIAGNREQLVGRLQELYGREKRALEKEIVEFAKA